MISVLFEDAGILAVNKPAGLSVHDAPGPGGSVLREMRDAGAGALIPVHRLDKDASGVLVLAKSKSAASELQREWNLVEKTYWVLCAGAPTQPDGEIDAPILENQTGKPERLKNQLAWFEKENPGVVLPPLPKPKTSAVHPAGRPSRTAYKLLETFRAGSGVWSTLEVRPHQGRMHQIRVHLVAAGLPLAVDPLYGQRRNLESRDIGAERGGIVLSRLPLHAMKLKLSARNQIIEAPLPPDLESVLRELRTCSKH